MDVDSTDMTVSVIDVDALDEPAGVCTTQKLVLLVTDESMQSPHH